MPTSCLTQTIGEIQVNVFHNDPEKLKELDRLWKEKPWTRPRPVSLKPSMGYGDRLGLATPGHLHAHRAGGGEGRVVPLYAQQSAREMERTGRTPVEVMLDAVRAVGESDYRGIQASDADHMKAEEQVAACVDAGFTWFTADPSDVVRDDADDIPAAEVESAFAKLLAKNPGFFDHYLESYVGQHPLEGISTPIEGDEKAVQRVALKYGPALYRSRQIRDWVESRWQGEEPYDFEISVDETSAPTSPLAHFIIAREIKRLGIRVTSLAPRFEGEFQKGIDYIGDLAAFRKGLHLHAAIAKQEGPYKISVHSGSDKFSVYPILAEECGSLVHLKTAGTSYLEALRVAARKNPALLREIAKYSATVFEEQRATYHIKAHLGNFPDPDQVPDGEMEFRFLASPESDDPRQILHVCFGAVLLHDSGERFGAPLKALLRAEAKEYEKVLSSHFVKHLVVFEGVV